MHNRFRRYSRFAAGELSETIDNFHFAVSRKSACSLGNLFGRYLHIDLYAPWPAAAPEILRGG